jgi:hypothetical protein
MRLLAFFAGDELLSLILDCHRTLIGPRGLAKETPGGRVRSMHRGRVISKARLGGLHHRYDRAA